MRWSALLIALTFARQAGAQRNPQEGVRRTLLRSAYEISTQHGDHARALALATEAGRIRMTPSLHLFLAEEHEYLSNGPQGGPHLLDAAREAGRCIRDATAQSELDERERTLRDCTSVFNRLNTRIARVRVIVAPQSSDGTRVLINGNEVERGSWGEPLLLLPGDVVVVAERPGRVPQRQLFLGYAGSSREVNISWAEDSPRTDARPAVTATMTVTSVIPPAPPRGGRPAALPVLGWAAVASGALLTGVGLYFWASSGSQASASSGASTPEGAAWVRYYNEIDPLRRLSPSQVCDRATTEPASTPDAAAVRSACDTNGASRALAYGLGVGGVVLAAGGVAVLLLTRSRDARSPARVDVAPLLASGFGGASLRVRF